MAEIKLKGIDQTTGKFRTVASGDDVSGSLGDTNSGIVKIQGIPRADD